LRLGNSEDVHRHWPHASVAPAAHPNGFGGVAVQKQGGFADPSHHFVRTGRSSGSLSSNRKKVFRTAVRHGMAAAHSQRQQFNLR
jgi:hypothetical protein